MEPGTAQPLHTRAGSTTAKVILLLTRSPKSCRSQVPGARCQVPGAQPTQDLRHDLANQTTLRTPSALPILHFLSNEVYAARG